MGKDWKSARANIRKYYVDERQSVSKMRSIMKKEHGFDASLVDLFGATLIVAPGSANILIRVRSYRAKLAEWEFRLVDTSADSHHRGWPPVRCRQTYSVSSDNSADLHDAASDVGPASTISESSVPETPPDHESPGSLTRSTSPHDHFEKVLRQVHEAPPQDRLEISMPVGDYHANGQTFLHYIAARGRMNDVLRDTLGFCKQLGYSVDELNDQGYSALHIAIQNDRFDNVQLLLDDGASLDVRNPQGELPLHMAVMSSQNLLLVSLLLERDIKGPHKHVERPSDKAGRIALDLVVDRVMRDISASGKSECTYATRKIVGALSKKMQTVENRAHLEASVRKDSELFLQAVNVLGRFRFGVPLSITMMSVFQEFKGAVGFPFEADCERVLPQWQGRLAQEQHLFFDPAPESIERHY